jgi:hypothetical protein
MKLFDFTERSEQFTTLAGEVIPERIVPASLSINTAAVAAAVVAVLAMRSR